ncbi:hypothetical protein [Embleya sp. NBC_00896]|uniref:hypothetical protein n=1 Tax=Embleya sp. NBC_00896 TaxID=2975961 RepID=UPI002F913110|nr:hypothetical protein OG928_48205 [Embleya sp. NBC_00896]
MSHVRTRGTLLGTQRGLEELAAAAEAHARGPGVSVIHTLAAGNCRLTVDDVDDAVSTLSELANSTAATNGARRHARAVRNRLTSLRHVAPLIVAAT